MLAVPAAAATLQASSTFNAGVEVDATSIGENGQSHLNVEFLGTAANPSNLDITSGATALSQYQFDFGGSSSAGYFVVGDLASLTVGGDSNYNSYFSQVPFYVYGTMNVQPDAENSYKSLRFSTVNMSAPAQLIVGSGGKLNVTDNNNNRDVFFVGDANYYAVNGEEIIVSAGGSASFLTGVYGSYSNLPLVNYGSVSFAGLAAAYSQMSFYCSAAEYHASLINTGAGMIFLQDAIKVYADQGYYQGGLNGGSSTAFLSVDASGNTLAVNSFSTGINIGKGTSLSFNAYYGQLNLTGTVTFGGKLYDYIDASNNNNRDYLYVTGTFTFGPFSFVQPIINGTLGSGGSWWKLVYATGGVIAPLGGQIPGVDPRFRWDIENSWFNLYYS